MSPSRKGVSSASRRPLVVVLKYAAARACCIRSVASPRLRNSVAHLWPFRFCRRDVSYGPNRPICTRWSRNPIPHPQTCAALFASFAATASETGARRSAALAQDRPGQRITAHGRRQNGTGDGPVHRRTVQPSQRRRPIRGSQEIQKKAEHERDDKDAEGPGHQRCAL